MSIDILKADLKNNQIKNLYLFYGPEEYLKKYYLDSIEKKVIDEELKSLNKVVLDGKVEVSNIIDNCETMPVFSEKKLVIVKNSGLFKSKRAANKGAGKNKDASDELTSYLQSVPEYTCLVFYEEEIDKRMKTINAIKKNGLIVEFPFQKPAELVKWVVKVFKSYKKQIDVMTASQLVENSEQGMTEILNEINKVILYTSESEKVSSNDIERVCTKSIKSRIFDLTDAIAERKCGKALKLLDDMIILREPVPKIIFMINRQFRQILQMKLLSNEGISANGAASKIGVTPYAAGKILRQANSFTRDTLKDAIRESLELDVAIKTGKINDRMAAELLIAKFSKA